MDTGGMGAFIRARREKLGMTQSALAAAAGMSRAYLSQIETGKVGVTSPDVRRRIAAVIGARQIDLLVAAGELTPDEVSSVARRWPSDDEARNLLHEAIERYSPLAVEWSRPAILGYVLDPAFRQTTETSPESSP